MSFEVYERKAEHDAWTRKENINLVADKQLEVRDDRHPNEPGLTFHPLGPGRVLVQANFHSHYGYGVLEVHNREGILKSLDCANIDQKPFLAAGGTRSRARNPNLPVQTRYGVETARTVGISSSPCFRS